MGLGAGLAAAAAAVGSAVAEAGAAIAAISLTTAFEVTAAVGAGLGVIGAITKDKTLSMVGLAIGAIGGIGALATSAGVFGAEAAAGGPLFGAAPAASTADAGSAFGAAASDASNAAGYGATSAFATGDAAGATAAATEAGTGLAAPLTETAAQTTGDAASSGTIDFVAGNGLDQAPPTDLTTANTLADNTTGPASGLPGPRADGTGLTADATAPPPTADASASPTVPGLSGPGTTAAPDLGTPPTPTGSLGQAASDASNATTYGPTAAFDTGDASGAGAGTSIINGSSGTGLLDKAGHALSSILGFADKHPAVAYGAVQAGGSFLSGLTSTLTPAQVNALNAQAAANQAAANMATQQQKNLAMPKATATLAPVTGTPSPIVAQAQPAGLINQPPRLAPVTGVPA